ncbi:TonB-dependent receptor [Alteromonas sp. ZYF713]|nr:TonB-dependent receptor [Alteromonas sp. ZYF713]
MQVRQMDTQKILKTKLTLAIAVALNASIAVPALSEEDEVVEKIMVTAQKRTESIQDVPISMSVVTQAQLKRDQINNLVDLQKVTPGLEMSPTFGAEANGGGRVRGIGSNLFSEGAASSVAVVVDEIPSGNIAMPAIFDMGRVEVLRGPQGTLFGQSASVGVINISSVAPEMGDFFGTANVIYSNNDYSQALVDAAVNLPVTDDSALRIAVRSDVVEGVQYNKALDKDLKSDTKSIRVRYRNEEIDDVKIDLIAEYHDVDEDHNFFNLGYAPTVGVRAPSGAILSPEQQLNILTNCGDAEPFSWEDNNGREFCSMRMPHRTRKYMSLGAIVDWDLGTYDITSITSYRTKKENDEYINLSRIYGGMQAAQNNNGLDATQISQELRLASNFDGPLNYIAGIFLSSYETEAYPTNGGEPGNINNPAGFTLCVEGTTNCSAPVFPTFAFEEIDVSIRAIFVDGTYELNDRTTLFGGLRLTHQTADYLFYQQTAFGISDESSGTKKDNEPSGRIGLRYKFDNDMMMYGSIARGFKGSVVSTPSIYGAPLVVLNPEISTSYEIGLKKDVLNGRVSLDGSLFYMEIEDYQAAKQEIVNNELQTVNVNVPVVESYGLELNARGNVTENLTMNAGYLYNSAEYPDGYLSDDPAVLGGPQDLGGRQLYLAPEHKFTISAEYSRDFAGNLQWFANTNAVYKSDVLLTQRVQEAYTYDAHWNIGGAVGIRATDNSWSVSLFGRNLTDEAFPVAVLAGQIFGQENGAVRVWPGPGITNRQIGATLNVNF